MADLNAVQDRAVRVFRRKARTTAELPADTGAPRERFSVFKPGDQERALELAAEFMKIAGPNPGPDQLDRVLDRAEQAYTVHSVEFVKYALMVYSTHAPGGWQLPVPSLEVRNPEKAHQHPEDARLLADQPSEDDLFWFREDPLANEHHERWHMVYPAIGVPDANGKFRAKHRQGELFAYMHQQMLARYDAERLAIKLDPVQPFDNYRGKPGYAYEPTQQLLPYYGPRPDEAWHDTTLQPGNVVYRVSAHEQLRDALLQAVENDRFPRTDAGANAVGATVERPSKDQ